MTAGFFLLFIIALFLFTSQKSPMHEWLEDRPMWVRIVGLCVVPVVAALVLF